MRLPALLLALPLALAAPQAPTLDDATIVAIFDGANTADIETGRLAEQRGASNEVRAIGASLARDHEAVRQQGRDLAQKLGVTPTPPKPNPYAEAHAKAMRALSARSGADFDRAFLDHEIAYHQAVIDAVTGTLLPAITNPDLKAFVEKIAPAFQAHLDMTKAAKRQLGY
jgi:putative membrane protein